MDILKNMLPEEMEEVKIDIGNQCFPAAPGNEEDPLAIIHILPTQYLVLKA